MEEKKAKENLKVIMGEGEGEETVSMLPILSAATPHLPL